MSKICPNLKKTRLSAQSTWGQKKPCQLSGGNLLYCRGLLGKFCKEPKTMLIYGKDSLAKFKRYCVLYFVVVTHTPAKYEFVTKFNSTKRTEHCNPCISIPPHSCKYKHEQSLNDEILQFQSFSGFISFPPCQHSMVKIASLTICTFL